MSDSESSASSSENSWLDESDASTENSEESNSLIAEDRKKWVDALDEYLKETQATSLDFGFGRGDILGPEETRSILKILPNSQVTDLNLCSNYYLNSMVEDLLQLLLTTKINKLDVSECSLQNEDILCLMAVLKDASVTELNILRNETTYQGFNLDDGNDFISYLVQSRLTRIAFDFGFSDREQGPDSFLYRRNVTPFLRVIPTTTITSLSLSDFSYSEDALSSLFSNLPRTSLTELSLKGGMLKSEIVKQLSFYLRDSKLVSLDLSKNLIEDAGIDALAVGLTCSKITTLDISNNSLNGSNILGLALKDSHIKTLNVSCNSGISSFILLSFPGFLRYSSLDTLDMSNCRLGDELGQALMRCLKFSKITKLKVTSNGLQLLSASEFAKTVKDTEITDIDFSWNYIPFDGIVTLGNCLGDSKLKNIRLTGNQTSKDYRTDPAAYSAFLEKTRECTLESVNLGDIGLRADGVKIIANSLVNTAFTYLNLQSNAIGDGAVSLAANLKFTAITRLTLTNNELGDAGAESLAKCLSETKITHLGLCNNSIGDLPVKAIAKVLSETRLIQLDLTVNNITSSGAQALASSLKSSNLLHLDLYENKIQSDGLEALAKHAEGTFITTLDMKENPVSRIFLIESILLKNGVSVHHFVSFFKRIAPETSANSFRLEENVCDADVDVFLEECLVFYKTVTEKPSAISVIVQEESFSYSWDQVVSLLKEEFPRQFATFVMNRLDATLTQHVDFLRKVEELGLSKIVDYLLLNRPALMIDENGDILHPYVYLLLHKYKQPLYNSSIEPEGKMKIINYFSEHSELDSAVEVLNLLRNDKKL